MCRKNSSASMSGIFGLGIQRFIFLVLGISFILAGVLRSEVDTVLSKAIKLCLECVGIG